MLPLGGRLPLQPPEAVQASALAALHCSMTEEPMGTVASLAFSVTDGAGTAAAGAGVPAVPEGSNVCAFELAPHAASAPDAVNASRDFNANAYRERWLRRIEFITRLPRFTPTIFFAALNPFIRNL